MRKIIFLLPFIILPAIQLEVHAQAEQPVRPDNFKPFEYPSPEYLMEKYSLEMMDRAAKEMARVRQINRRSGNFRPIWPSLDSHETPEWFKDAKFGLFINWGLYSIPAYAPSGYPDWYLWRMMEDTKEYHNTYWGEDFRPDDFISLASLEDFDAEYIAEVAKASGAKYVVPFLKHHDGFALWNSSYTHRNSVRMGPERDIAMEWKQALQKRDLKFGFYYSIDDWFYPIIGEDNRLRIREWHATDGSDLKIVPYNTEKYNRMQISGKIPVRDIFDEYINPKGVEFIDKYDPDILWGDGGWIIGADERNTRELFAYFYNQAKGRKEVAAIDEYGLTRLIPTRGQGPDHTVHGDFYRSEALYHADRDFVIDRPWEETSGLSHSFGYNWQETDEDVRSAREVLTMLIDVVAGGGNLLLMTNLTPTGKLDPLMAERLQVVGNWLDTNGEAIFATRRWDHYREDNVRFTRSKDGEVVYAIVLDWPGSYFTSNLLKPKTGSTITMLGHDHPLEWNMQDDNLQVNIPRELIDNPPAEYAWVFRVEVN